MILYRKLDSRSNGAHRRPCRALIVGETSAGSSGQPLYCRFKDGMSFRVGAKRQFFADGPPPFEGVGITPDIVVSVTRDDLAEGRDIWVAAALEAI